MTAIDERVHERTLIGAVDSYLGYLVHVRPHVASKQREQLEAAIEQWAADGGANAIEAPTPDWLNRYLVLADEPAEAEKALRHFYRWALREGLTEESPLAV